MKLAQPPVILLAFANHQRQSASYLTELNKERLKVKDELNRNDDYHIETIEEANLTRIRRMLSKYKGQVQIFHYSGHAYQEGLELHEGESNNRTAFTEGIVDLIKLSGGVKMVFLNGCFTEKHIQAYHQVGVAVVIGTTHQVKDEVARVFSEVFYESWANGSTIAHAFQTAEASIFTLPKKHREEIYKDAYRDIVALKGSSLTNAHPYKLSVMTESSKLWTWKQWEEEYIAALKEKEEEKKNKEPQTLSKPIHKKAYLTCDRSKQLAAFKACIQRQLDTNHRTPSFFFVFGANEEVPDSFVECVRTFTLEEVYRANGKKLRRSHAHVKFPEVESLQDQGKPPSLTKEEAFKKSYFMAFSTLLGNYRIAKGPLEGKLGRKKEVLPETIINSFGPRNDMIIIEHRITLEKWSPHFIPFLRLYMQEFWCQHYPDKGAKVMIIFSIEYEKREDFLSKLGMGFPTKKMKSALVQLGREVEGCTIIEELGKVTKKDVRIWRRDNPFDQSDIEDELFSGKEKRELPMKQIEKKLKQRIDHYLEKLGKTYALHPRMAQ